MSSLGRLLLASKKTSGPVTPTDTYFPYVAMLFHGNGANGATNNTFTDSSSNALAITRNGSVTSGSFSPYGANWSVFSSATSSNYLTYGASTSASAWGTAGTSAFTIEAWIYLETLPTTAGPAGDLVIWQKGRSGTSNFEIAFSVILAADSSGYQLLLSVSNNGGSTITNVNSQNVSLTAGQWYHIAVTRTASSATVNLWFQGTKLINSGNMGFTSGTVGSGAVAIGNNNAGSNPSWQGYVSNLRVLTGTELYTANFTPPTSPLTAITNTNFLGCQSNRFIDNSTNAWPITVTGTPVIHRFNPFGVTGTPYAAATYGGGCYFPNNSSSSLSVAANAGFGFGTGAFTIEAWIYVLAFNSNSGAVIDLRSAVAAQATEISVNGSGQLFYYDGPNNTAYTDPTALILNTWYHVALTRDGSGVWRLFKNGVQVQTSTAADNLGTSQPVLIGQSLNGTSNWFNGYVSDLRIVKGTALYTSTFTPPTSPLSAVTNTQFLLHGTDAVIFDNAMQQNAITAGIAQISTAQQKFGSGSVYCQSGTANFVASSMDQIPTWGSMNWTIEGWFYIINYSAGANDGLFGHRNSINFGAMALVINNGFLQMLSSTSGSAWTVNQTAASTISTGTWIHLAMVRNGTTLTLYENGTSLLSGTVSGALYQPPTPFCIGSSNTINGSGNNNMNGYWQDFRITFGVARYTASFTPPSQLPNQ